MTRIFSLICFFTLALASHPLFARMNTVEQELALYDCKNGNNEACDAALLASLFIAYLPSVKNDRQNLVSKITSKQLECDDREVKSCTELGVLLLHLESGESAKSYELFTDSCDLGDGWACGLLGEMNVFVEASKDKNYQIYYEKLERLCAKDDHKACATQARLNVLLAVTPPERSIWYDQLVSSCQHGVGRACVNLSYLMSEDGKQEYRKFDPGHSILDSFTNRISFSYAKRACELDNPVGCWNAALAYSDGRGVRADLKLAQENFVKACVKSLFRACDEINYDIVWRSTDSHSDLNDACDERDFSACLIVEQRRFNELSPTQKKETQVQYLANLKLICKDGSLIACANAAVRAYGLGDTADAERYANVACNHEIGEGCLVLGNVWKFNKLIEGHHTKAIYYLERGCELGSRSACNNLGDSYRKGLGLEVNLTQAKRYFKIACNHKLKLACRNLSEMNESN